MSAVSRDVDMAAVGPSAQPFQCLVCFKRFTRHENLKRHATVHNSLELPTQFPCDFCSTTFVRQDLRRRHVKYKHPDVDIARYFGATTKAPKSKKAAGTSTIARILSSSAPNQEQPPHVQQQPRTEPQQHPQIRESQEDQTTSGEGEVNNDISRTGTRGSWSTQTSSPQAHGASAAIGGIVTEVGRSHVVNGEYLPLPANSSDCYGLTWMEDEANVRVSNHESSQTNQQLLWVEHSLGGQAELQVASLSAIHAGNEARESGERSTAKWSPSALQIENGIRLFFHHVAHAVPFLHEPTFDSALAKEHLVLSILCLGYYYGEDPDVGRRPGSGVELALKCYRRALEVVESNETSRSNSAQHLVIVQTYLLLQICAMFYIGGDYSWDGRRIHSTVIALSRSSGLMQSLPTNPAATSDLESMWKEFIKAESHKRTMLVLHHMDALWYQLLSIPRAISHLEVKHDMPCHDSLWTTSSASAWAHRTLIATRSAPAMRYNEAIRLTVNPDSSDVLTHQLELQGLLNVIHFLQSSLREISGWSAMTGLVSSDRFEALTNCLSAMEPSIRSRSALTSKAQSIVVEATWEMAMVDMLSWSASHMGGVVEVSIDAALATASFLASTRGSINSSDIPHDLQGHLDWFLIYLDRTEQPDQEPPFVAVYAYKAFLVAFQLLRGGIPDAMTAVGVADGDIEAALEWAEEMFRRREKWMVGGLILQNLRSLGESL